MEHSTNRVPKHIGLVLDGNRRFAKKLMLKPWRGHEFGAEKVEKLLDWCKEFDIRELTLYVFSWENFNRPKEEFDYLMELFRKEFTRYKTDARIHANKIRLNVIGRLWRFPLDVQKAANELMDATKDYSDYVVNFAMGYGGRQEVIDAVRKISEKVKSNELDIDAINEELFSKELYLESEPDLIIRTGGDKRTSNFLLWQSSYSEWFFIDKPWPEFEKADFLSCIEEFSLRERRFGH